ncbi:oxidoreductase [Actinocatenispora thailandica]|uniref:Oxidoreductase n=1 Tax=Actinocatenispora thailandica TaxID=227318 RepID=A0A7R7DRX0_9ACTN|nr:SDR family oxidoreductase [Actinocatenispora thailandica]BCJ36586.1 oxidoreductase [Actinocatenispora thailandica]
MRRSLRDAVVLVTGPARGIGERVARLAAARGARLALVGLEAARLAALAAELGDRHSWYRCDVTDQAELDAAVAGTIDRYGRIDVVVANAGIANNGTVAVNPADALARTVEVNLIGVMRTVSATLPALRESRGYALLVSSAAAFTVLPGMAAYCASKAGVEQFGNALRLEVAHHGVAVGTAHPIWVDTDLVRDQQHDLRTFRAVVRRLPYPLNTTITVEKCALSIVDGIERRARRVYAPRSLAAVQALRTIYTGPVAGAVLARGARTRVPELEAEVRALGRSFGSRSAADR